MTGCVVKRGEAGWKEPGGIKLPPTLEARNATE
jgi:hypothetical protein